MPEDNLSKNESPLGVEEGLNKGQFVKLGHTSAQNNAPYGIWKKKFYGYFIAIPLGIVFQLLGILTININLITPPPSPLELILLWPLKLIGLIGTLLLIYGLAKYAQKKGYSWVYGYTGVFGFLGLILVFSLRDLNKLYSTSAVPAAAGFNTSIGNNSIDTLANKQKISPNQNGKPKKLIGLLKKFLIIITSLLVMATFSAPVIVPVIQSSVSHDFYWNVIDKILHPIVSFMMLIALPTLLILGSIRIYLSLMERRTESLARNNTQLASQQKTNWIDKLMRGSILVLLGLLIAIIYLFELILLFIFSFGGEGLPQISYPINPLIIIFLLLVLLVTLNLLVVTRPWTLLKKLIFCLIISVVVFTPFCLLML